MTGGWACYCADSQGAMEGEGGVVDCNTDCRSGEACGGVFSITVYRTPTPEAADGSPLLSASHKWMPVCRGG